MPNPTRAAIAAALAVDRSIITRWAKRGLPLYSIEAARTWRAQNIRPRIANRGTDTTVIPNPESPAGALAAARLRRELAEAQRAEHELGLLERRLCYVDDVRRGASEVGSMLAAELNGLAARLAPRLVGLSMPEIIRIIDAEQREIRLRIIHVPTRQTPEAREALQETLGPPP